MILDDGCESLIEVHQVLIVDLDEVHALVSIILELLSIHFQSMVFEFTCRCRCSYLAPRG